MTRQISVLYLKVSYLLQLIQTFICTVSSEQIRHLKSIEVYEGATCHGKMKFPTTSKFNAGARKTDYTSKFVLLIF